MPERLPARRSVSLIVGLLLILVGLWISLKRLGFELPELWDFWPLVLIVLGAAFFAVFLRGERSDPGVLWPGTACLLLGLFSALFTLGPLDWWQMESLWPILFLIAGFAFVATWLGGRCRHHGLLIPAFACLAAGVLSLGVTYELLEDWLWPSLELAYPAVFIVLGLILVIRALLARRPSNLEDSEGS